jgi:hypothetical protein
MYICIILSASEAGMSASHMQIPEGIQKNREYNVSPSKICTLSPHHHPHMIVIVIATVAIAFLLPPRLLETALIGLSHVTLTRASILTSAL